MNYEQAVKAIENIPQIGKEAGVVRSKRLLERLGNPHKEMKIIHVAGTNGKGSVCMYITRLLRELGYSVGTFISPHLVKLNERIMLNECAVSDECFAEAFNRVNSVIYKESDAGYFDVLFAMAMLIYSEKKPDYVVLETGLGGKLDGSNAVDNKILTVITSISLDHCALLGNTTSEIAEQKAGIIRSKVPLVWDASDKSYYDVIANEAKRLGAPSYPVEKTQWKILSVEGKHIDFLADNRYYRGERFTLDTYATYQVANAMLALTAVNLLCEVPVQAARRAFTSFYWKGRMDRIADGIYMDGAHNVGGIGAFIDSVRNIEPDVPKVLLFSVVRDKKYDEMIELLCKCGLFDSFVVTQIEGSRMLDGDVIRDRFAKYTTKPVVVENDAGKAFLRAVDLKGDNLLFIAGSLYLAGIIEQLPEVLYDKF